MMETESITNNSYPPIVRNSKPFSAILILTYIASSPWSITPSIFYFKMHTLEDVGYPIQQEDHSDTLHVMSPVAMLEPNSVNIQGGTMILASKSLRLCT